MAGDVTARGVYKNLEKSPYWVSTPYGDIFKFPSQKKKEVYGKRLATAMTKFEKFLNHNELINHLDPITIDNLLRAVYLSVYASVVR